MKLSNLKVATRLALGFGVVFIGALLLAASGWFGIHRQANLMATVVDRDMAFSRSIASIRTRVQMLRRFEKDSLLNVVDPVKVKEYKQKWDESRKRLEELTAAAQATATSDEEKKRLESLTAALKRYESSMESVYAGLIS